MESVRTRRAFNARLCALLGTAIAAHSTSHARTREPPLPGLELQFDDSQLATIEVPPGQAAEITAAAAGAQAAGIQTAASMPGYTVGAGVAGGLIGTAIGLGIARHFADAKVRKIANAPVEPLRKVYAAEWRELRLRDSFWSEWDAHASPDQQRCTPESARKCARQLTLQPALLLLSGARILCVSIEAKLQEGKAVQTKKVSYLSRPVTATQIDAVNELWSREHLRALSEEWLTAVAALVPMLQTEIGLHDKPAQQASQAIRFVNDAGLFYDRGVILSRDAQRIVYRSLDGSVTSAPIERLLTTEEYYNWMAGRLAPQAP